MDKQKQFSKMKNEIEDYENRNFIKYMCKSCKFYKDTCQKKRVARVCAQKGLKNKD